MTLGPFDTDTMAELYAAQKQAGEAAAIYRRLLEGDPESDRRAHREQRLRDLTALEPPSLPPPTPGARVSRKGDAVLVTWSLPEGTPAPTLEVLLITRGEAGVACERRRLPLLAAEGFVRLDVAALLRASAAVGRVEHDRFVVMAVAAAV